MPGGAERGSVSLSFSPQITHPENHTEKTGQGEGSGKKESPKPPVSSRAPSGGSPRRPTLTAQALRPPSKPDPPPARRGFCACVAEATSHAHLYDWLLAGWPRPLLAVIIDSELSPSLHPLGWEWVGPSSQRLSLCDACPGPHFSHGPFSWPRSSSPNLETGKRNMFKKCHSLTTLTPPQRPYIIHGFHVEFREVCKGNQVCIAAFRSPVA